MAVNFMMSSEDKKNKLKIGDGQLDKGLQKEFAVYFQLKRY